MDPYRDPERILRDRLAAIDERLAHLAAQARERDAAARTRADLEAEKATVERELLELNGQGQLERLRIASPCKASWDKMVGDDRVRFCGQCQKNVYNFSAMSRAEAVALVQERTGELCVRMYRREDGTVMSTDCPVGVKKKRVRRLVMVGAGLGAAAAASAFGFTTTATTGAVAPHKPHVAHVDPPVVEPIHEMGDISPIGSVTLPEVPPPPPPQTRMGKVAMTPHAAPTVVPAPKPAPKPVGQD